MSPACRRSELLTEAGQFRRQQVSRVQSYDLIGHRRFDGLYELLQRTERGDVLLEGPFGRVIAESRLRELANEHGCDPWIEESDGSYRPGRYRLTEGA